MYDKPSDYPPYLQPLARLIEQLSERQAETDKRIDRFSISMKTILLPLQVGSEQSSFPWGVWHNRRLQLGRYSRIIINLLFVMIPSQIKIMSIARGCSVQCHKIHKGQDIHTR